MLMCPRCTGRWNDIREYRRPGAGISSLASGEVEGLIRFCRTKDLRLAKVKEDFGPSRRSSPKRFKRS